MKADRDTQVDLIAPAQAGANRRDWTFHAERINAAWGKQVASILETGRYLIDAREEMERAAFEAMVQQKLSFGPSAAREAAPVRCPCCPRQGDCGVEGAAR